MSRAFTQHAATHQQIATTRHEPFLQVVTYPGRVAVHMRSERMRRHGFVLCGEGEIRALVAALKSALVAHAEMPPSCADMALAEVCRLLEADQPTNHQEEFPS